MTGRRVLITGVTGLLGQALVRQWRGKFWLAGLNRGGGVPGVDESHAVDLAEPGSARRLIERVRPDLIVHTAAWTDVDGCERDPQRASQLHEGASRELARAAARHSAQFVYVSTQAVFDGERGHYTEEDVPRPLNTYARTKLAGERAVLDVNPGFLVVRVPLEGWRPEGQPTFVQWVVTGLRNRETRTVCTDWVNTPVFGEDVPGTLADLLRRGVAGVQHVTSLVALSNWEVALEAARVFNLDSALLLPITSDQLPSMAPRPRNVSLMTVRPHAPVSSVAVALERLRETLERAEGAA